METIKTGRLVLEKTGDDQDGGVWIYQSRYQKEYFTASWFRGPEHWEIEFMDRVIVRSHRLDAGMEVAKRMIYNVAYEAKKAWELGIDAMDHPGYNKAVDKLILKDLTAE